MKNLHFKSYMENFLYDLDNFITIYEDTLHVFNFTKLNKLSDTKIVLKIGKKLVLIEGVNLRVGKMTKQELLINGEILKVEFKDE